MSRKRHQAYTEDFRRAAVKLSDKPGLIQAQIANWKRQFTRLSGKRFSSGVCTGQ